MVKGGEASPDADLELLNSGHQRGDRISLGVCGGWCSHLEGKVSGCIMQEEGDEPSQESC